MMKVDSDNYPETLGKTLIINAPTVFRMVFNMFKPALDARTQAKIEVIKFVEFVMYVSLCLTY